MSRRDFINRARELGYSRRHFYGGGLCWADNGRGTPGRWLLEIQEEWIGGGDDLVKRIVSSSHEARMYKTVEMEEIASPEVKTVERVEEEKSEQGAGGCS